jgi:hypothetical protein
MNTDQATTSRGAEPPNIGAASEQRAERHRSRRRKLAGVVAALAVATGIGLSAAPAQAVVTSMTAALSCSNGVVDAYPPSGSTLSGTNAEANLTTKADLYVWTSSGWQYVTTSGWWANGATDDNGRLGQALGTYWVNNGGVGVQFYPFSVTPGRYYSVRTWVEDMTDGRITYTNNHLSAFDYTTSYYCLA